MECGRGGGGDGFEKELNYVVERLFTFAIKGIPFPYIVISPLALALYIILCILVNNVYFSIKKGQ